MPVPVECQQLEKQISSLRASIEDLQRDLARAAPQEKHQIIEQISEEKATLEEKGIALAKCIRDHPPPPPPAPPPPFIATFTGTASLQIDHPRTPDPFVSDVIVPLEFRVIDGDLRWRRVTVLNMPVFGSRSFPTPVGEDTSTIRLSSARTPYGFFLPNGFPGNTLLPWGSGQFSGTTNIPVGWMEIWVVEETVDHSISLGDWFEVDSILSLSLTTEPLYGGVPMDSQGRITLVGNSEFYNGILVRRRYSVRIVGVVSPHP